jgi:large subunit ribosomal protein L19
VTTIEVVRHGRVRRAKLTYMRGRKGRSARIREAGRVATVDEKSDAASPPAPSGETAPPK